MGNTNHDDCVRPNAVFINERVNALKEKHANLSVRVDNAQKDKSTTDYYLNQLKKQKLFLKEKLFREMARVKRKSKAL